MEQIIKATQPVLEEVKDKLESWRKNKVNHRQPIPKDLWQAAADLARDGSINQVSKALRLSYADLKCHVYGSSVVSKKTGQKRPSFIELKYSQPLMPENITVDIENKKGCRMRIYLKGNAGIFELIKSFCKL